MTDEVTTTPERPEWLPEKFKTPADLANAYKELEKNYSAAPESYDLTKSKFMDGEHAVVKELAQFAKSKRVPAEVMDKFQESVDKYFGEFSIDPAKELEKIGGNAKERITKLTNFVKAHLDDKESKELMARINTAESVLALEKLRNKFMSDTTQVPSGNAGSGTGSPTAEDMQAELTKNLDKYKTDPAYRRDYQARLAQVQKKGFVDKTY